MRIAIIGNSTMVWLSQYLGKELGTDGIEAAMNVTEYEQYVQALVDPDSELHSIDAHSGSADASGPGAGGWGTAFGCGGIHRAPKS